MYVGALKLNGSIERKRKREESQSKYRNLIYSNTEWGKLELNKEKKKVTSMHHRAG